MAVDTRWYVTCFQGGCCICENRRISSGWKSPSNRTIIVAKVAAEIAYRGHSAGFLAHPAWRYQTIVLSGLLGWGGFKYVSFAAALGQPFSWFFVLETLAVCRNTGQSVWQRLPDDRSNHNRVCFSSQHPPLIWRNAE